MTQRLVLGAAHKTLLAVLPRLVVLLVLPATQRLARTASLSCQSLDWRLTLIPWEELPQELGFGSGMTCWLRLRDWQAAGVWHRLHLLLLDELRGAGKLDFSPATQAACRQGL